MCAAATPALTGATPEPTSAADDARHGGRVLARALFGRHSYGRWFDRQALAHQVDVPPQVIELVGIGGGDFDRPHVRVDAIKLGLYGVDVRATAVQGALQRLELAVPIDQAPAHHPDVEPGQRPCQ